MVGVTDSNSQGHISETSIEYNNQGNPSKFISIYSFNRRNPVTYVDSFVYDHDRVAKIFRKSIFDASYKILNTFRYDNQDRLIADANSNFSYDANGNVVECQLTERESDTIHIYGEMTAKYNGRRNPFNNLGIASNLLWSGGSWIFLERTLLLSENEVTQVNYQHRGTYNYIYNYTYNYDSDGNLKRIDVDLDELPSSYSIKLKVEFFYD